MREEMKPVIAVSSSNRMIEAINSFKFSNCTVSNKIVDKIFEFGAQPIIIPNYEFLDDRILDIIDGVVLTPGQDISPEYYGETLHVKYTENINGLGQKYQRPIAYRPDKYRDMTELKICRQAQERNLPILGICRGMQIINVAFGGTLFQEIEETNITHNIGSDGWIHYHELFIKENSIFYALMGQANIAMSSVHHQAVKTLGEGLIASASSEDGIIEVIESENKNSFILGIQGHFEFLENTYKQYMNIWASFVEKSKEYHYERK
ncbi:gamma-glutamyl-gamma-aminobutyrate hydrolase family protein [Pectobacteriaceae bacterium CE90]|nr:gamma-glutamyl-gamma-aminobutyrate hydrolase family protein [Pectobacteriaceae bacterium CE90]